MLLRLSAILLFCVVASLLGLAVPAATQEPEAPLKPEAGPAIDLGKVLRESKEFKEKCAGFRIEFEAGRVSAEGEIVYRGGGPCEYLVGVFPSKAHETVVLLDKGPWTGEGRRPLEYIENLAANLNNALLAAGFRKGRPFQWNAETGEVRPPKGETVHLYAEWKVEGKLHRARTSDWLWNHEQRSVMKPGQFVYTGSVIYDEGPPTHKKWLGAEVDGLIVAVLTTSSSLVDHTEKGGMFNGAYEAIPMRIPESGTRIRVVFSKKELEVTEKYEPLKLRTDEQRSTQPATTPEGFGGGAKQPGGADEDDEDDESDESDESDEEDD
ncbi:MAG: YdjY domain-containing protein [Planctomycetota bacterium]